MDEMTSRGKFREVAGTLSCRLSLVVITFSLTSHRPSGILIA